MQALLLALLGARTGGAGSSQDVLGAAREMARAELASIEGDFEAAERGYRTAIAMLPREPYLGLVWARWLARQGRLEQALEVARGVALELPQETEVWRMLGRLEWSLSGSQSSGLARALEAFLRVAEAQPGDLEAQSAVGTLRYQLGDFEGAAQALGEALRLRPDQSGLELLRARAFVRLGRQQEAIRAYERLVELDGGSVVARVELAEQLAAAGRVEEALSSLSSLPDPVQQAPEIGRRIAAYRWWLGDLEGSRRGALSVLEKEPEDLRMRRLLAWIERADGRFETGLRWLEPVVARPGAPEETVQLYLDLAARADREDLAVALLDRRLLEAERSGGIEEQAGVWKGRFDWWHRQGRFERLLEELERSRPPLVEKALEPFLAHWRTEGLAGLERIPEALSGLLGLGTPRALARAFELARVRGLLDQLPALRARLLETETGRAELAAALQRRELHQEALELLVPLADGSLAGPGLLFRLGVAYERTGQLQPAIEAFERTLAMAPDFAPALNYLGYLWIDRGENLERAVRLVERAVRLEPDNGAYVDSLGWGYFRLGHFDRAVDLLERASRLSPGDPTILEHLGDALRALGKEDRAIAAYRQALASVGADREALERKLRELSAP